MLYLFLFNVFAAHSWSILQG